MEDNEGEKESEKSEEKLGRLQYKLDYDFNSNNVSVKNIGISIEYKIIM